MILARSPIIRWVFRAAVLCAALAGFTLAADAAPATSDRKQPMRFTWHPDRTPDCVAPCGFVSAAGTITADTPQSFARFAENRSLGGVTIVLDSSGGSVLDAIKLGRRWRDIGLVTTVGAMVPDRDGARSVISAGAACESMCAFLLLAGKTRIVPPGAHVRVHQIWMGDRADDPRAATYSAQDVMIIERDVGRLAKYTFDMGGSGDLLLLALGIPPWEPLRELTVDELRLTNLVTGDLIAETPVRSMPGDKLAAKPIQDRLATSAAELSPAAEAARPANKATRTADASAPVANATAASESERR